MYKICHITSAHKTDDDRIFIRECSSLAKIEDYEVYIVGQGDSYINNGVTIIGVGIAPQNRKERISHFTKILVSKALSLEADVYHIHDPELLLYALKLKRNGKSKVIFDSHEYYSVQIANKSYIPKFYRNLIAKCYKTMEDFVCKRIDAVIFPCKINGQHPFDTIAKRCILIDNVPVEDEISLCAKMLEDKDIQHDDSTVEYTGSLSRDRGIDYLLEACNRANVKLILAGTFYPDAYGQSLQNNKFFKNVDYRGLCDREEVMKIHASSTIGASLLQYVGQYPLIENLPTKVYEYMMTEKPFIISDFNYARRIIDKYECGIAVSPCNVDEIVKGIKYLINNPEERARMGRNGREAIEKEFNWNFEEKKLFHLYQALLNLE